MYPSDWGPAQHRHDPTLDERATRDGIAAVQSALDRRDNGGARPDDN